MTVEELKQALVELCSDEIYAIDTRDRLPPMFDNVIVYGRLSGEANHNTYTARRWTGYSGPDAGRDELGGIWDWLTPTDRSVTDVLWWIPFPKAPRAKE